MTYSICGIPFIDTSRNVCFNTGILEKGIAITSNVSILTSPYWGTTAGFVSSGQGGPTVSFKNNIEKFPFSTDEGSACIAAISVTRSQAGGTSSTQHGYTFGGIINPTTNSNIIDKFPFSVRTNSIDVGDLTHCKTVSSGYASPTKGFASFNEPSSTILNKFPFSTDVSATSPGNLTYQSQYNGISSLYAGYSSGNYYAQNCNYIEKFPFATESTVGCVGCLYQARGYNAGMSSITHGYLGGGLLFPTPSTPYTSGSWVATIDKFPFSAEGAASSVGTLSNNCGRHSSAGVSAGPVGYGYTVGGYNYPTFSYLRCIDKINFSSDTNASCIGLLTETRSLMGGHQV